MLRRAFPLLGLPLLAACPTFSYGPEAFEVGVESSACVEAGYASGCTRFLFDNGDVYTDQGPQIVELRLGFESDARNLEHVQIHFEVPGVPLVGRTCALPTGASVVALDELEGLEDLEEVDEGFGCALVVLADATASDDIDVTTTAKGILQIDAVMIAAEPGSYAITAALVDENGFESTTVRWQFPVTDPMREPEPGPAGDE